MFDAPAAVNCSAHWRDALLARLAPLGGMTDPFRIKFVADLMELGNLSEVRAVLGGLLTTPQEFTSLLERSAQCAEDNVPLRNWACAMMLDERLAPTLEGSDSDVLEELSLALHFGIVLEKVNLILTLILTLTMTITLTLTLALSLTPTLTLTLALSLFLT